MTKFRFKSSTIGLLASHANLKKPTLIRVEFSVNENGDKIKLSAVSANTLSLIKCIKQVTISRANYADRDFDCYDDAVETKWAFNLLGITL